MARSSRALCFAALVTGGSACLTTNNPKQPAQTIHCGVVLGAGVKATVAGPCEVSIDFGSVPLGQAVTAVVEIDNQTSSVVDTKAFTPELDPAFTLDTTSLQTAIQVGATATLSITFQPFETAAASSTLSIPTLVVGSVGAGPSIDVSFSGSGFRSDLSVDPSSVDLGSTLIGTASHASFTVTNNSGGTISGITGQVGGADANLFTLGNVPTSLAAGASAKVDVTYQPLALEDRSLASLVISGGSGLVSVDLFGTPISVALTLAPNPIEFGFVALQSTAIACTTVTNRSNISVTISRLAAFDTSGEAFALSQHDDSRPPKSTALPITVVAGNSAQVCFSFTPTLGHAAQGEATLVTDDPTGTNPLVQMAGWGGGPQISCTPALLDFGPSPEDTASMLSVVCTNTGSSNANADLILQLPAVDSNAFAAVFNRDAGPYPPKGLAPGESGQIDVTYTPSGAAADTGTLAIRSNGGSGADIDIPLMGSGVSVQACQFQILPAQLDFGNVTLGGASDPLAFAIVNTGSSACLVTGVGVAGEQSGSAFRLLGIDPAPASKWASIPAVGPGGVSSLTVSAQFVPSDAGSFADSVAFVISSPGDANQTVKLLGTSEPTCVLVSPADLSFGDVGTGSSGAFCVSPSRGFSVFDGCPTPVTVQSLTLRSGAGQSSPQFELAGPATPFTIQPGDPPVTFQAAFEPSASGMANAQVSVSDGTIETLLALNGTATPQSTETDTFTAGVKADILFVLDVSNGIAQQEALLDDVAAFIEGAGSVDYRIAVTDDNDDPTSAAADFGRLLPCPSCSLKGSAPSIISPTTMVPGGSAPDPTTALEDLIGAVGTTVGVPGDQHLFQALLEAFQRGPAEQVDFFRPGAYLAVINTSGNLFDDNSPLTTTEYLDYYGSLFSLPSIFSWDLVATSSSVTGTGLLPSSAIPARMSGMLTDTQGFAPNTNDGNWESVLNTEVWASATAAASRYPLRGTPSSSQGISVGVDGTGIPASGGPDAVNWRYESATNSILFSGYSPAVGAAIAVTYPVGCN